jgi:glutathione S-transferase
MKSIKLTYFDIQGVAEKVRLALVLGGIPFADVRVPFDQWIAIKPTTPYGQLPTLSIDGAEPIAQSEAMLRYAGQLATENGVPLYPADKLLAIEEARGLVSDLEREWRVPGGIGLQDPARFGHPTDIKGTPEHSAIIQAVREKFLAEELPKFMNFLSKRLSGSGYLCGDAPTIADCALIPVLNRLTSGDVEFVPDDCLEPYPHVTQYVQRFMALPEVEKWYLKE